MDKEQFMGMLFLIGAVVGSLALLLSIAFHKLDNYMETISPRHQGDFNEESEATWRKMMKLRDAIRLLGLVCLYISLIAMLFGAAGMGIALMEGA